MPRRADAVLHYQTKTTINSLIFKWKTQSITFLTLFLVWPQKYFSSCWCKAAEVWGEMCWSVLIPISPFFSPVLHPQGPGAVPPPSGSFLWLTPFKEGFGGICWLFLSWLGLSSQQRLLFFVLFLRNFEEKQKNDLKKGKTWKKNTNLIGCPSDQVKDWALATRSGREGEKQERKREIK